MFPPTLAVFIFAPSVGVALFIAHVQAVPQYLYKVALRGIVVGGHLNKAQLRKISTLNVLFPPIKVSLEPRRFSLSAEIKFNSVSRLGKVGLICLLSSFNWIIARGVSEIILFLVTIWYGLENQGEAVHKQLQQFSLFVLQIFFLRAFES